ncbi:hypothetical protein Rsub_13155 [Raphidocelis subcapitata]|uniref:t-SNARE coiled-coil homology domain-containing protein n=1 Tax=Raphidocelis subcapitata TaxID=307507 RepID=A0A2V0PQK1_9CHLO|nr:hypothetical protein Rsub_13155 [Raphidocelis subcapitata]|eukprot:GBG00474.1 hypothetical protein Rsub_13155 [Raphidocelis subcapitata]
MSGSRRLNGGGFDVESLERENDRGIDALSERIGLLKQATHGIRAEVDSQHTILDKMADSMVGTHSMLGGAANKFKVVMADKDNRRMLTVVCGMVVVLLVLYYLTRR